MPMATGAGMRGSVLDQAPEVSRPPALSSPSTSRCTRNSVASEQPKTKRHSALAVKMKSRK
jgi:hypothetical protein